MKIVDFIVWAYDLGLGSGLVEVTILVGHNKVVVRSWVNPIMRFLWKDSS